MILEKELGCIEDTSVRDEVRRIISENEKWILTYPVSISGRHHPHEPTMEIHLKRVVFFAEELSIEWDLNEKDHDILIAACLLHDIGSSVITTHSLVSGPGWKAYPATGWSREGDPNLHPILGGLLIAERPFKYSREIQNLVETHMAHWHKETCREPSSLLEILCASSDYLASREALTINEEIGDVTIKKGGA